MKASRMEVTRNAKLLGELAVSNAGIVGDFSGGNIETRNAMLTVMRGLLQDREIGKAVVRLIPVDVMNMLLGGKFSTKGIAP